MPWNIHIILETPFNDEAFKDLIDQANNAGYDTTFIVLFLKSPAQSFERVAARRAFEGGLVISPGNVEHNFIENSRMSLDISPIPIHPILSIRVKGTVTS